MSPSFGRNVDLAFAPSASISLNSPATFGLGSLKDIENPCHNMTGTNVYPRYHPVLSGNHSQLSWFNLTISNQLWHLCGFLSTTASCDKWASKHLWLVLFYHIFNLKTNEIMGKMLSQSVRLQNPPWIIHIMFPFLFFIRKIPVCRQGLYLIFLP